jgi:hypothetical protein
MIDEDSAGFVEAFTAAVRPGEGRSRPGRWMLMITFLVAFTVALGALLNGAFGGGAKAAAGTSASTAPLGALTPPALTVIGSASATPSATKPVTWTAVAGPGCTNKATGFTESGYYTGTADPAADWSTSATGGYVGDGCTGGFVSVPLSGRADAYDSNRYTVWTFDLGAGSTAESCRLYTYVPAVTAITSVGGNPALYYYYGDVYTAGSTVAPLGDYAVSQVANRGVWVPDNSFTVKTGRVSVKMVDAGVNQTPATSGAREAAAQVRLACSAA